MCAFQILDGLGLGANGPPIPAPVTFSVVPFPVKRKAAKVNDDDRQFEFISTAQPTDETLEGNGEADETALAEAAKLVQLLFA